VICVSKDLYEECLRLGVPPVRCKWIHNGIDTAQFRRRKTIAQARGHFPQTSAPKVVGAMGRLSDEKGFDLLIQAVDRLNRKGMQVELWIAGEGAARSKLQALIDDLGQADRIKLLGHVDDTPAFYEALDVFALSSVRE